MYTITAAVRQTTTCVCAASVFTYLQVPIDDTPVLRPAHDRHVCGKEQYGKCKYKEQYGKSKYKEQYGQSEYRDNYGQSEYKEQYGQSEYKEQYR